MRPASYDLLFEPLRLGPVTTRNRFYQVPHCSGMGWQRPRTQAAMRAMKAEGGWGVVCTEYCSVHPSSDDGHYPFARLWGPEDVRAHALTTEAIHAQGALAGVELWHGGAAVANFDTRLPTRGIASRPVTNTAMTHPGQSRLLDRADIRALRGWQVEAARRAVEAGFDLVYVYATHGYLLSEFLDPVANRRSDEYGGSLENRVRIVRELIEETREAVAGRAAVATRFSVDLQEPESYEAFALLAELPDLWDLTVRDYDIEMGGSRFVAQGALEASVARARALTTKPVVAVGRFTSPDTMARVLRSGAQDLIGAARPSIADPFLPSKIESGRIEDIRECIGCNVCYAHDTLGVPIRCTQNPTMGEEWRRGWHPERVPPAKRRERVLVVGAGPAGLEAARVLGERGFEVLLAEASRTLGGRVAAESRLPGLAEWGRVRDWRVGQIEKLAGVSLFRESPMAAADALAVEADHILVATGARWTSDGIGRSRNRPLEVPEGALVVAAEALLSGAQTPPGHAVIFDDDHYYLGPVLALALRARGNAVTLVTTAGRAGDWSGHTGEAQATNAGLLRAGVRIVTNRRLEAVAPGAVTTACVFAGERQDLAADWLLPLTRREPVDGLYRELAALQEAGETPGLKGLQRIGDCEAPNIIAAAVYSGYKAAVELEAESSTLWPWRRDVA
ncbi:dimethylamine/trimethylamine dehydrogenase [Tistlia consotensis]|uniref:Dimethylamine/trimethylamine dehydrogenase n=1 Tax=Tistlia consotensis USBA 355 TaxID=560819 RepID=A0A1Y6B8Z9_9PROT|nr:FAD-dependent oxidoreductase [Tistlia consotensis]SME97793.1 dimethylamine/trimethylamine dehydrogenase [Tistlia consotensis USBA 355]SNR57161.1 dimethylamine/trimethylamine dehydrogenase [Tistlia consotensis]